MENAVYGEQVPIKTHGLSFSRKNGIIDVTFLTENPTTKVRNKRKEAT